MMALTNINTVPLTFMGNVLKCEAKIEEDNWIVLRISDIPKKWSDFN